MHSRGIESSEGSDLCLPLQSPDQSLEEIDDSLDFSGVLQYRPTPANETCSPVYIAGIDQRIPDSIMELLCRALCTAELSFLEVDARHPTLWKQGRRALSLPYAHNSSGMQILVSENTQWGRIGSEGVMFA
jgi:hypothetical protein